MMSQHKLTNNAVAEWIAKQRYRDELLLEQIPFSKCDNWIFKDGRFQHITGRFFSIIGCYYEGGAPHLKGASLPMLDQPEIGVLGFVVRRNPEGSWDWLLQAKTEPGNVGGVQVGPTVQATKSNYMRVHGGQPTLMLELFTKINLKNRVLLDVEQSEQGDRFLGKYNRNMVVSVGEEFQAPPNDLWKWFGSSELREALHHDFTVNTDSRSVICSSDWSLLTGPENNTPFSRWQSSGEFGESLFNSSMDSYANSEFTLACFHLNAARQSSLVQLRRVKLESLSGWLIDDWEIHSSNSEMDQIIQAFSVYAKDREVQNWCQPLMTNRSEGRVVLVCAWHDGIMKFMLNISFEPGFKEGAQYAPSYVSGCTHSNPEGLLFAIDDPSSVTHASVMQSDEGGRFMSSIACYEIVELTASSATAFSGEACVWVSLAVLQKMTKYKGLLSNEMRSVLSLLLKWV